MTVSYQSKLTTHRSWVLIKLLFSWKGSIYKVIWPDLTIFSILYFALKIIYKLALTDDMKRVFEVLCRYCDKNSNLIPVSFVLGFYVSIVMTRWWNQYETIPWPSSTAVKLSAAISGQDDRGRLIRRTIIRYLNLAHILTFRKVSCMVMKRFPTLQHIVDSGMLNESEKNILEKMTEELKSVPQWLPAVWAVTITKRAYMEGKIQSAVTMQAIIDSIDSFRGGCGKILSYDWISVPLMYTQVVSWAVYTFFLACIMGRQFIDSHRDDVDDIDLYIPVFTFLQFFFYMGWLKVAQTLMNPFGEDDDDFEMNYIIDNNIKTSFLIVDEVHGDHPEIVKDQFWDETVPSDLPYTIASEKFKRDGPPPGSAEEMEIPEHDLDYASLVDVESDIYESVPGSAVFQRKLPKLRKGSFLGSIKSTYEERMGDKEASANQKRRKRLESASSVRSSRIRTTSENSRVLTPEEEGVINNLEIALEAITKEEDVSDSEAAKKPPPVRSTKLSIVSESNEFHEDEETQTELPVTTEDIEKPCVHCGTYPGKPEGAEHEDHEPEYSTIIPNVTVQSPVDDSVHYADLEGLDQGGTHPSSVPDTLALPKTTSDK